MFALAMCISDSAGMLTRPQITYLPGARNPSELQRRLREYDDELLTRDLNELDAYDEQPRRKGRPLKELPPAIARVILKDLAAGKSKRFVWRKYGRHRRYSFDRRWLDDVLADGRLERMAAADPAPA